MLQWSLLVNFYMSEFNQIVLVAIPFLAYILTVFGRKYLFVRKNIAEVSAFIENICLYQIDEIWSPEIQLEYSFYIKGSKYKGKDFISMDKFFGKSHFLLTNQRNFPILSSHEGQYIGGEHIEHYLLQKKNEIIIEYHQNNPFENRIYKQEESHNLLFEHAKVNFPWVY